MKPIFLIGYMGCGKSTLGRNLARLTTLEFIDLDSYIETRFHANVRDIFATRGEEGFRIIERNILHEVGEFEDVIVACGGGTPCHFDNIDYMNSRGTTVFLNTSIPKLHTRLMRGRHKRPLIASLSDEALLDFIKEKLAERMKYYTKASASFAGDLLENEVEVSHTANRFIEQFGLPTR